MHRLARLATAITPATKAINVVHAFGHVADMDPIRALAEAPGATYKGRLAGSIGDFACSSFFANKIMTTGEGGIVLTKVPAHDKATRILRDHGMSREKRYHHVAQAYNYGLTNMQTAIGLAQLKRFDDILARRAAQATQYAAQYAAQFDGHPAIQWRPTSVYCGPVHWMATIMLRQAA